MRNRMYNDGFKKGFVYGAFAVTLLSFVVFTISASRATAIKVES